MNRRPLTAPVRDIAVYQALLALWLGDNPADPQLKSRLLGHAQHIEPAPGNDVRL